jgi:hypothetical protein
VIACAFGKKHQIVLAVIVIDKDGATVHAALSDVEWNMGYIQA